MSSLWTPGGERPVRAASASPPPGQPSPSAARGPAGAPAGFDPDDELTEAEMAEQMTAIREQLANTPAAAVVANHCYGLFELAALHLSLQPPQLGEAQLAIDALTAVVDGVGPRLGEHLANLNEGLAQLKLAFVQIRAANLGAAPPPDAAPSDGPDSAPA